MSRYTPAARQQMGHGLNRGERNGAAKLTADTVREIRTRRAAGETRKALSKAFNVGEYAIRDCVIGTTWGWLE